MDSSNIGHYPLNKKGCLELGISPCTKCFSGFANYSNKEIKTCYDSCKEFAEYIKMELNKNG